MPFRPLLLKRRFTTLSWGVPLPLPSLPFPCLQWGGNRKWPENQHFVGCVPADSPTAFPPPKSIRRLPVGFMLTQHWPRGITVTRLYGEGSLALSLIRSSGETRAHRSRTRLRALRVRLRRGSLRKAFAFLRCISARPAFLTVCRLLYSADSFHSASPAEFCSAYLSPPRLNSAVDSPQR